ncbi:hypothetical protein PGBG_00314 [Phaeocystis globosa virus 14T]|uniref:Serine/threonine kinase n=1 Tax=Phaeocystis globosa virus PgV-16T TaxID=3071227 RepID=A0AC59EXY8_9VIRU|nr:serine/threonine kinase [Phaeocystis globosa virus]AET74022.1 hypothetical protein PGBG_00314 [Phaeocystis globosa virus 14T]AGM15659.1 serine/threonine kinase [Phaeocystis globosa virus PgV-16T]UYE94389.1 protein kinase [Phaeocystis globosa virus]
MSEKIGVGTSGCVFKPSLKCDKNIGSYENKISKVMKNIDAKNELKEYKSISKIKGLEKYAIVQPTLCKPKMDDKFVKSVYKCFNHSLVKVLDKTKSDYSLLLYEDGGITVGDFLSTIFTKIDEKDQHHFLTSLITLIDGLSFFKANDIVHRDIKADHIVYNINTGKLKYIDFGLMIKNSKAIELSKKSKEPLAIYHGYWPWENSCRNFKDYNTKEHCEYLRAHHSPNPELHPHPSASDSPSPDLSPSPSPIPNPQPDAGKEYNYDEFLKLAIDSFDLYTLGRVFQFIGNWLMFETPKYEKFGKALRENSKLYTLRDLFKRDKSIKKFRDDYIKLLKDHNITSPKGTPSPSAKIQAKVEKIVKEELKKEIKKKECPPEKPIRNPKTNRCLMTCKDRYIRNEEYKCVLDKSLKKKSLKKKSLNKKSLKKKASVTTKKLICAKKNMDYNTKTKRCNKKK